MALRRGCDVGLFTLVGALAVFVLSLALPVGRISVVNETTAPLADVLMECRCGTKHAGTLAPGETASLWFWGCGDTDAQVSFADVRGRYDRISGGYLDPAPSGAITVRVRDDAAVFDRGLLLSTSLRAHP